MTFAQLATLSLIEGSQYFDGIMACGRETVRRSRSLFLCANCNDQIPPGRPGRRCIRCRQPMTEARKNTDDFLKVLETGGPSRIRGPISVFESGGPPFHVIGDHDFEPTKNEEPRTTHA